MSVSIEYSSRCVSLSTVFVPLWGRRNDLRHIEVIHPTRRESSTQMKLRVAVIVHLDSTAE